jgi:hypothetical protein
MAESDVFIASASHFSAFAGYVSSAARCLIVVTEGNTYFDVHRRLRGNVLVGTGRETDERKLKSALSAVIGTPAAVAAKCERPDVVLVPPTPPQPDWCWLDCGSSITLSGGKLVATRHAHGDYQLATGGSPMTEGRHYWEVEITTDPFGCCNFLVGAVRPGLDHDEHDFTTSDGYYIYASTGVLIGNGQRQRQRGTQGGFTKGDRVGVLLDLDAGWMRFYRNSKRWGTGFTEGVTGPLLRAVQLDYYKQSSCTILPGEAGAGARAVSDEQWQEQEPKLAAAEWECEYAESSVDY